MILDVIGRVDSYFLSQEIERKFRVRNVYAVYFRNELREI